MFNSIINFSLCIILWEIKLIKKKISHYEYFLKNINFFKYLLYIFDDKVNPLKSYEFNKFVKINKKKWSDIDKKFIKKIKNNNIIVENFINHQSYSLSNLIIGKYLSSFYNSEIIGLLWKWDIKGKILFKSFGVKNFLYLDDGNFFIRLKYLIKSINILSKVKTIKHFCKITINGIDIGLTSYDSYLRFTGEPTLKKINLKLIVFFSEALYLNDYYEKILSDNKIKKVVQAERQFIWYNILLQKSLKKKKKVYTRVGSDHISVRIYNNFSQRYESKSKYSMKLVNLILKTSKKKSIKQIDKFYRKIFYNKLYGKPWGPYIKLEKNLIKLWKNTTDPNFKTKSITLQNLKNTSRDELCKILNWDKKNKIATIFFPNITDGNFQNGPKKLYYDNTQWILNTLKIIQNIKYVNWLIKIHPDHLRYNVKMNLSSIIKKIEKKNKNIRLFPESISPSSIKNIIDVLVTSHSSAGLEYSSFGIPCIVAENSYYSHCGFNYTVENISDYKKLLKNVNKIKKLNKKKIEIAKIYLFIFMIFGKVRMSLIPYFIPIFENRMQTKNENIFWDHVIKYLKTFDFKKDKFGRMFKDQLILKYRHTVQSNLKKKLELNDF